MNNLDMNAALELSRRLSALTNSVQDTSEKKPPRKYVKRKKMFRFSTNATIPLPPRERGGMKAGNYTSPNTIQGRMTAKILSLKVGEMFTMTFDADPSEVSSRLTVFRRRFPDVKITTRKIQEGVLGIWRIA